MPDPVAQTHLVRGALAQALHLLKEARGPDLAAQGLQALMDDLVPPPEPYPELIELDTAIGEALRGFTTLACLTDETEITQVLRTLRRVLLSDRRRVNPDPERHQLDIAISQRQLWLISHRSGWLSARSQAASLAAQRDAGAAPEAWQEPLQLLQEYLTAQEGYGRSLRQELEQLQARRML